MSNFSPVGRIVLTALAVLAASSAAAAGSVPILAEVGRGYSMPVRTIKEIKLERAFSTTVRQQYDFSCGSAAVATLLTHHYGSPVSESAVFQAMYESGDKEKIRREGFSLLDMKRYLETQGYKADGVQVSLDKLVEAGVPAIALISDQGYRHFVVVKGLRGNRVLLGDPALGARIVRLDVLERSRVGEIFFVIRNHRTEARFNGDNDWMARLPAPIMIGVGREGVASMMLAIPGADRF